MTPARSTRWQRPLLYPSGLAVGFVLLMLDASGVSLFAALRPLLVAGLGTFTVSLVLTWLLGDRHPAALVTLVMLLTLLVMGSPLQVALLLIAGTTVVVTSLVGRVRPIRIRWELISRVPAVLAIILLLAVGIRSIQDGRLAQIARDVMEEGPLRAHPVAWTQVDAQHPDIYLILLDAYPRADKLLDEFGIDNAGFMDGLRGSGFSVAAQSRSNYLQTQLTLMSMFDGAHVDDAALASHPGAVREGINDAMAWRPFIDRGYETVSIPTDFDIPAMRWVDRFIDTGQLNEFERVLLESTVLPLLDRLSPGFLASQHGERIMASLDRAVALAGEDGPARLAFVHVAAPHAPVLFRADGSRHREKGLYYDDRDQAERLGPQEYASRLADQIAYLNRRLLEIVQAIDRSGRPSVVVVFSDHGSGVRYSQDSEAASDLDLRTANLLAVRGVGEIDDRSTLVNLLPLIASRVFGVQHAAVPEDIRFVEDGALTPYERPD